MQNIGSLVKEVVERARVLSGHKPREPSGASNGTRPTLDELIDAGTLKAGEVHQPGMRPRSTRNHDSNL
jgi:hypothetical protein